VGNSGRPKGARNKTTLALEVLLEGEAALITRKAIDMAKESDTTALRLCMDRLLPPRKDRAVLFTLPKLESAKDAVTASAAILEAVANGDLTPMEASELSKLVANYVEALKTSDLEERLAKVEARTNQ
jgi:hypothetical protein